MPPGCNFPPYVLHTINQSILSSSLPAGRDCRSPRPLNSPRLPCSSRALTPFLPSCSALAPSPRSRAFSMSDWNPTLLGVPPSLPSLRCSPMRGPTRGPSVAFRNAPYKD
ncbi:hypothetical protein Mapa_009279 [Marchantia paleacea]|nr:hypothetical protein Mapa_009279 [Marchantia paleacea]